MDLTTISLDLRIPPNSLKMALPRVCDPTNSWPRSLPRITAVVLARELAKPKAEVQ